LWGLSACLLIGLAVTVAILGKTGADAEQSVVFPKQTFEAVLAGLVGLVILFVVYVSTQQEKLRRFEAENRQRALHEEVLRARLNELAGLLDVSGELSQKLDLRQMLELAARRLLPCLEADHSSIVLFNPRSKLLEEAACVGKRTAVDGPISVPPGEGVIGHVFQTRETLTVEAEEARVRLAQELGLAGIPCSAVCAPIVFEDACLGVFCVARIDVSEAFTAMHARALHALAEQCGAAIVRHFHPRRGARDLAHVA
jgi:transcriptional regulator with GAF, ATPase, and Fis domain